MKSNEAAHPKLCSIAPKIGFLNTPLKQLTSVFAEHCSSPQRRGRFDFVISSSLLLWYLADIIVHIIWKFIIFLLAIEVIKILGIFYQQVSFLRSLFKLTLLHFVFLPRLTRFSSTGNLRQVPNVSCCSIASIVFCAHYIINFTKLTRVRVFTFYSPAGPFTLIPRRHRWLVWLRPFDWSPNEAKTIRVCAIIWQGKSLWSVNHWVHLRSFLYSF